MLLHCAVFVLASLLNASEVRAESCDTDCHKQCTVKIKFPRAKFVEPTCHAKCEAAKKLACIGVPVPTVPLTPREQIEKYGTIACSGPYESLTKAVIARCSNWDNRLEGQDIIDQAIDTLIEVGIFSRATFGSTQIRWCPLTPGTAGMAPDRNRVYLDSALKNSDPIHIASTLAHEMIHVRQYRDASSSESFKCAYSRKYLECGGCQNRRHPMEREAYDFEDNVETKLFNALGYSFRFTNNCNSPVRLAIRFVDAKNEWRTEAWWNFSPNQTSYLIDGKNKRYRSKSDTWYYFAETLDGTWHWAGNLNTTLPDGRQVAMIELKDTEGDNEWAITCNR